MSSESREQEKLRRINEATAAQLGVDLGDDTYSSQDERDAERVRRAANGGR